MISWYFDYSQDTSESKILSLCLEKNYTLKFKSILYVLGISILNNTLPWMDLKDNYSKAIFTSVLKKNVKHKKNIFVVCFFIFMREYKPGILTINKTDSTRRPRWYQWAICSRGVCPVKFVTMTGKDWLNRPIWSEKSIFKNADAVC